MEIEVSDIKQRMGKYFQFLRKWRLFMIFAALAGTAVGFTYAKLKPPKYEANLSFIINESDKGLGGSLLSLAGQSGFLLGSSGMTPSEDKIMFLMGSRRIVGESLLKSYEFQQQRCLIANQLIEELKVSSYWSNDTLMNSFQGIKSTSYEDLSRQENKAIDLLVSILLKGKFITFETVKKKSLVGQGTGIIYIQVVLKNEELAQALTQSLYSSLSDFYITNSIQKLQSNVDLLKGKVDSITNLIHDKESALGYESDYNFNIFKASGRVKEYRLKRDLEILYTIFAELMKNYELSKLTLEQQKPYFKVIDNPTLPLKQINKSQLTYSFLAGLSAFLGTWLLITAVFFMKIYDQKNQRGA